MIEKKVWKIYGKKIIVGTLICMFVACGIWWFSKYYSIKYNIDKRFSKQITHIYNSIEDNGSRFAFKGDSLTFWSDNTIPVDSSILNNKKIIELKNGYYLHKVIFLGDNSTHYLYLIKSKYNITNQYINNYFAKPFDLNENVSIINSVTPYPIVLNGETIGYLEASKECLEPNETDYFILCVWLCINIFFTILYLLSRIKRWPKKRLKITLYIIIMYTFFALLAFLLFKANKQLNFKLYSNNIDFKGVLFFIIVVFAGFLVYYTSEKMLHINRRYKYYIIKQLGLIWLLAIIGGTIGEACSFYNNKEQIKQRAQKLMEQTKQDDFAGVRTLLWGASKDAYVDSLIINKNYDAAEEYISKYYLSLLHEKYHTGVLVFDNKDSMVVQPNYWPIRTIIYVSDRLSISKKIDSLDNFYVENENFDNKTYLYCANKDSAYIFVECMKKIISKNMNYSLLLDNTTDEENNISYAKYVNNVLIYSNGEREFQLHKKDNLSGWVESYNYYTYYINDKDVSFAVCGQMQLFYNLLGAISLFFLIYVSMFSTEHIIRKLPYVRSIRPNIKNSILLVLLGSFFICMFILGLFGIKSIHNLNVKNNLDTLREKTKSIQFEVEKLTSNNNPININDIISLSNSFLTDINIFDIKGNLKLTSQEEIFSKGYLLPKINSKALIDLKHQNTQLIYQEEQIGKSKFLASYCPIRNDRGKAVYYLNIPFINQQKAMRANINNMINNFANMFLFWLNIAVMLFIFLSNLITKPLDIIKEKLSKVNVDVKNDKIVWDKNDEIGELVKSYNRMIDKIEDSSILLKQQERQSSWRELAKQVAHDIKNPLTPMKLSIQYLQKLYIEKPDLFDKKWKEISPSLISQIETISTITGELNNYSRPSANREKVSLNQCIQAAVNLYSTKEDVKINFNEKNEYLTLGDKKLFIRIFNNLIKNAIQSFYDREYGKIDISIKEDNNKYIVSIKDNGSGIKHENQSKIFNTHFTTKQDGGGIGLTIVKSILESYDASIDFKSKENIGTVFYITFNVFKENR